jgi:hypothetical protein
MQVVALEELTDKLLELVLATPFRGDWAEAEIVAFGLVHPTDIRVI